MTPSFYGSERKRWRTNYTTTGCRRRKSNERHSKSPRNRSIRHRPHLSPHIERVDFGCVEEKNGKAYLVGRLVGVGQNDGGADPGIFISLSRFLDGPLNQWTMKNGGRRKAKMVVIKAVYATAQSGWMKGRNGLADDPRCAYRMSSLSIQFSVEPGFGPFPIPHHSFGRYFQDFRRLLYAKAPEVSQLHHPAPASLWVFAF
jgi:hypothetical protein